jgi:uncharacterized membrane protein YtjA (UPF0391 family)
MAADGSRPPAPLTLSPAAHSLCKQPSRKELSAMLHYAVVFLVIALIAALFGFTGIAAGAAGIAQTLFVVFLILAVVAFVFNLFRRGS